MTKYSLAFIAMFIKFSILWSPETGFGRPNGLADSFSGIEPMFVWAKLPACWQGKLTKQSALLKSHYGTDTFFLNLVLLCGGIMLNPGPGEKHPCAVCNNLSNLIKKLSSAIIVIAGTMHDVVR